MASACKARVLLVHYGFPISQASRWILEPFLCVTFNCQVYVIGPMICSSKQDRCQNKAVAKPQKKKKKKNGTWILKWRNAHVRYFNSGLFFFLLNPLFFSASQSPQSSIVVLVFINNCMWTIPGCCATSGRFPSMPLTSIPWKTIVLQNILTGSEQ